MKAIVVNSSAIKRWMSANVGKFVDPLTNEVNCTLMVETWDIECASGGDTLSSVHPAWDLAVEVGEEHEKKLSVSK